MYRLFWVVYKLSLYYIAIKIFPQVKKKIIKKKYDKNNQINFQKFLDPQEMIKPESNMRGSKSLN